MARSNPLDEIQAAALDPDRDLASVLRKCLALGGATGSESLREWAARELKGYRGDDELPGYRTAAAPLLIDGTAGFNRITGQMVPPHAIPEFARDKVTTDIEFRQPIAELVELIANDNSEVRMMPAGARELVAIMNSELAEEEANEWGIGGEPTRMVERLYWSVSRTTIARVVDVVRTTLVELVAEMRATMPSGVEIPSREVAEQAVQVAIYGGKRHRVVVAQGGDTADAAGASVMTAGDETTGRRRFWWIVGFATVVGSAAAVVAIFVR